MKKLIFLTDYKNKFGSKHFDIPYRSGMDKTKLVRYFSEMGIEASFQFLNEVRLDDPDLQQAGVIYTSSEDIGYRYKSYIEDVIFALELKGVRVIPAFKHLRANNNKVFMEYLREILNISDNLNATVFGSLKDLEMRIEELSFPCVFKKAEGASGKGVALVKNREELISQVKKVSGGIAYWKEDLKDIGRALKHKGYMKESVYRDKFIIQDFIPNLTNDWKIYHFGNRQYIINRPILKGRGIKASGGGYDNYFYGSKAEAPPGIFNLAETIRQKLDVPHVSIDIAYDGKEFYIIEFQSLYFGTAGIPYSDGFYQIAGEDWVFTEENLEIEKVYADSIASYLKEKST